MSTVGDTQLNDTQAAIMGLILSTDEGIATGHEIMSMYENWIAPYFSITRSQVYRELPALTERDLVKPGTQGKRGSLPYKVTPKGKVAMRNWMNQDIGLDSIRNAVALRIAFSGLTTARRMESLVEGMQDLHQAEVKRLEELVAKAHEQGLTDDEQALRFALMYHQAALTWLDTVTV